MNILSTLLKNALFQTFLVFLIPASMFSQEIFINEFMASNGSTLADEMGDFDDWVELYNAGNTPVDIGGMYLTDDLTQPTAWQIPTNNAALTTIPAGGFLLLWFDKETDQGPLHVDAKLGSSGEDIGLFASDGTTLIDGYTYGEQLSDISEGRTTDGGDTWDFFTEPTPGASNDTDPGTGTVERPVASVSGGFQNGTVTISLSSATPGATIYYTTDGSVPTENATVYNNAIAVTENTALRARAFKAPLAASDIMTENYLFNINHSFAVVAYTADPDELFDDEIGMYPNYEEDIEINANAELYEPDGTLGFNQYFESEIQGTGSASLPQKSLALKAKSSLGSSTIDYQVFPDLERDQYRSLVLRSSGQDWNITMFRDAVVSSLVRDLSDLDENLIETPDLNTQAYRPGVVYINGEYWGIHNIRERIDKRYIKVHFDLDDNEIDYLDGENEAKEGDLMEWDNLQGFLQNNNLSGQANFDYVAGKVDLDHYLDFVVFNVFIDNHDWPGNNAKRFRERSPDGQWQWFTYDLDFSFGLFTENNGWNSGYYESNSLSRMLTPNGWNWPNPDWSTLLFRRLAENDAWRTAFINRMADQLNVLYSPDRIVSRIDAFEQAYLPEIQQHADRWSSGWHNLPQNAEILRYFANGRREVVYDQFVSEFSEISGTADLTVDLNTADQGEVLLNTITISQNNAPWTGKYFTGVDIPLEAFPVRGYILESWSGATSGNEPLTSININSNATVTAHFTKGSIATDPIVINEINYNSPDDPNSGDWIELYNPNDNAVDISGWYFEDESGDYYGIPGNTILASGAYLVLVEDEADFIAVYPFVSNYIGEFGKGTRGFGLSGGGEYISIKNADGILIDEVEYDDNAPWPEEADGNGPTLQLIDPALDNALATSWEAIPATPGAENGVIIGGEDQEITFPAINDKLTTDAPFAINATASSGLPVSFSILSGPASIAGNTITLSGTAGVVTVQASQSGNAQWNPAPNASQSFTVTEPSTGGGDYCDSKGTQPWQQWISNVTFANINNNSAKNGYGDFTNLAASVETGADIPISVTPAFSYFQWDEYVRVWIDYNQDGDFTDTGETVFSAIRPAGAPLSSSPLTGTITIPDNASTGATRMRVSMQKEAYAGPCETFTFGEVEDYTIIIVAGGPGNPITLNCPGDVFYPGSPGNPLIVVDWTAPTGTTTCPGGGLVITQQVNTPPPGTQLSPGDYEIEYNATDDCGNTASCTFTISIDSWFATTTLTCPADIIVEASSPSGAVVSWTEPEVISDCPNGTYLNQLSGSANGSLFPIGTTEITYAGGDIGVAGGCTTDLLCGFNVIVTEPGGMGEYCESSGSKPWQQWIGNVTFGSINNDSGKNGYGDFTALNTNVIAGEEVFLSILPAFSYFQWDEHIRVWIDYNQDGDFFDAGELVYSNIYEAGSPGSTSPLLGLVSIPANAATGTTRMRVSMQKEAYAGPCDAFVYGEVEDYSLTISSNLIEPDAEVLILNSAPSNGALKLMWTFNTGFKTKRFILEKANEDGYFQEVSIIENETDSDQYVNYEYQDFPEEGIHSYRIKQVFKDETFRYSNIETTSFQQADRIVLFPNPVLNELKVSLRDFTGRSAEIQIFNQYGQLMDYLEMETVSQAPVSIDTRDYRNGMYFLTVKTEDSKLISKRFIVGKL